jgi:ABC-2 type transport system permease protein
MTTLATDGTGRPTQGATGGPTQAASGGAAPHAWRGAKASTQLLVLTGRSVRALFADRRVVLVSLLQPLLMLFVISQVFGAIVDTANLPAGVPYIDYLVPAILVTTGIGPAAGAGVGLIRDMDSGVLARFRALPVSLPLVLVARSVADLQRVAVQLTLLLICAVLLFDFTPAGGPLGVVLALLLALLAIWALTWIFLALAAYLRSAEAMQSIVFVVTFPLMFASSAFVPVDRLPGWLQAVAVVNPLTHAIDASRHLALGTAAGAGAAVAVGISLAVATVAGTAAARWFSRPHRG